MPPPPAERDLILVGSGQSHLHALKSFGMSPVPGVRLTLVAREDAAPWAGMLPTFVAGHRTHGDCHVDLRRLARFAGARLIQAEAAGLDRAERRLLLRDRPSLRYDLLSLDLGSSADRVAATAGSGPAGMTLDHTPAAGWDSLLRRIQRTDRQPVIVVIGGGATGVELVLAVAERLSKGSPPFLTLVARDGLLPGEDRRLRDAVRRLLEDRGIILVERAEITAAEPGLLLCADGRRIDFDEALWTTPAGAAPWLRLTGLSLDADGYLAVDETLRSVNDPLIFASGDIATTGAAMSVSGDEGRAGRSAGGTALADNLRRALSGDGPRAVASGPRPATVIVTGDRRALAMVRGGLCTVTEWAWRRRDRADRAAVAAFQDLPLPEPDAAAGDNRLPAGALARALERLGVAPGERVMPAPVDGGALVQTVETLSAETLGHATDDPYLFGRIAANHALNGLFALGAEPVDALALVGLPPAATALREEDLFQTLRGGLDALAEAGGRLSGARGGAGAGRAVSFVVTGSLRPDRRLRPDGLRPGQRLILTKPLGNGAILADAARGAARPDHIGAALDAMRRSNGPAMVTLLRHGATAAVAVADLGLLSHLLEMLRASRRDARLDLDALPALAGALEALARGPNGPLHAANVEAGREVASSEAGGLAVATQHPAFPLLFDPQVAGGLLASVPAERSAGCLAELRAAGYPDAVAVGTVVVGTVGASARDSPRVELDRLA